MFYRLVVLSRGVDSTRAYATLAAIANGQRSRMQPERERPLVQIRVFSSAVDRCINPSCIGGTALLRRWCGGSLTVQRSLA